MRIALSHKSCHPKRQTDAYPGNTTAIAQVDAKFRPGRMPFVSVIGPISPFEMLLPMFGSDISVDPVRVVLLAPRLLDVDLADIRNEMGDGD